LALSGVGSGITILTVVSDSITACGQFAVGSASVGDSVGVGSSVITLFTGGIVDSSVSAEEGASDGASGVSVQNSVIALLASINDTITANWESAVGSAGVGDGGREISSVALFANVQNSVTASGQFAVGSAARGLFVGVVHTQVALFVLTLDSITAFNLAVGVAAVTVDVVSIVTSFSQQVISNTVTTVWEDASRSTSVGQKGIENTSVTLFLAAVGIDDTITAVWESAVGSASVGHLVVVVGSVIALLSDPGSVGEGLNIFLDSISASAFRDWWESVKNGLEDRVRIASLGEEDGQHGPGLRTWVLGFVEQLDFEGESSVSNDVLRGLMEFHVDQVVSNSSVAESSSVQSREQNVVSSVEQNNWGRVVLNVGWVVEVESSGSWARFGKSDGGLSVSRALSVGWWGLTTGSSVNLATWEAERFSVAFLSGISNVITASVGLAVGSACIGGRVVILSSIIAFLTNLNNAITADGSGSRVIGWHSNTGGGCSNWVSTIQTLEISVGGRWNDVGKSTALSGSQQPWLLNNEPSDVLGAWWSSFGTSIGKGSNGGRRNQKAQVNVPSRQCLTASIQGANR